MSLPLKTFPRPVFWILIVGSLQRLIGNVPVDAYLPAHPVTTFRKQFSSTSIRLLNNKKNAESNNEWGIPYSSTLPPLVSSSSSASSSSSRQPRRQPILPNGGRVTLLGSGPGDPDLLTVAAYRLLTVRDPNVLVIADRLVSQEILNLIPNPVKVARKLPGCAELAQEEIYWWTYQALNQGKHVIRLKIGDPFVFGRGGEEVLQFRRFGVEAKVIPVRVWWWWWW